MRTIEGIITKLIGGFYYVCCGEDIYEGDDYYVLNGFNCCVKCLDIHFKFTAEKLDYEAEIADLEYHDLKN